MSWLWYTGPYIAADKLQLLSTMLPFADTTQTLMAALQQQRTGGALMLVSHLTEGHRHVVTSQARRRMSAITKSIPGCRAKS